ncbi:hypothetical protein PsYK624_015700 [Phanerochaete sordida]|uniref:Uncharacterized protein n=1 Tax=Phanerochaete sordida TaxID=48140 RepID=A0A9P3FZJ1_9APHY|nr:hypothetical protein PsYK624_015700 [Phanerochaete sordida]
MALSLAKVELIGTLLEAICYGMYFILFVEVLRVLYARHRAGRSTWSLLVATLVIFSLITTHLAVQIARIVQAFTDHLDVANAAVAYFNDVSTNPTKAKSCIYMLLTLICDTLLVYRVFVIYGRRYWTLILPCVLTLTDIGLSAWFIWSLYGGVPYVRGSGIPNGALARFNYFYGVTLALNLMCTVMISWKIWTAHRRLPGPAAAGVRVMGVFVVIIESAAVYTCLLVALIALSALSSVELWLILDPLCPIIGMVFSAVMVRASREFHQDTFMTAELSLPIHLRANTNAQPLVLTSPSASASHQILTVPEQKASLPMVQITTSSADVSSLDTLDKSLGVPREVK